MKDGQMREYARDLRFSDRLWKRGKPTLRLPFVCVGSPDVGIRIAEVEREKHLCTLGYKDGILFFTVDGFDGVGER